MPKFFYSAVLSLVLLFANFKVTLAAPLAVTQIGTLETQGATHSEWWYVSENPVLVGTAGENAVVSITIDTLTNSVTANATGEWTYQPTNLTAGDHEIEITSGTEEYSFTLHIEEDVFSETTNNTTTTTTTTTTSKGGVPDDLPETGTIEVTIALIAGALILMFTGYKFARN